MSILFVCLTVNPLAAQTNIREAMDSTRNSLATGKLAALPNIYLISAPKDEDTAEVAAARLRNRESFGLAKYESILHSFRKQHDALAARYNSEVAQALATGRVPDPTHFIAELDGLVYSTMNEIRKDGSTYTYPNADIIGTGEDLTTSDSLRSPNGAFTLTLETDGALVLRRAGGPVWSSGVQARKPSFVELQLDGNLAMYDASGAELWTSGTSAFPSLLRVTDAGTAIIQDGFGRTLWTNGVLAPPPRPLPPYDLRSHYGLTVLGLTHFTPHSCLGEPGCESNGVSKASTTVSQTLEISGVGALTNNYCVEHLFECAIVTMMLRLDNLPEWNGRDGSDRHVKVVGGFYNYNEETIVLPSRVSPDMSFPANIGLGFQENVVADPAYRNVQTGHTASELKAMLVQNKAAVCFAVTYPAGAEVYVDGLKAGVTALGFALIRHDVARVVTVEMAGYKTVEKELMPDGSPCSIGLTLEKDDQVLPKGK
jgi:hypothetical protein